MGSKCITRPEKGGLEVWSDTLLIHVNSDVSVGEHALIGKKEGTVSAVWKMPIPATTSTSIPTQLPLPRWRACFCSTKLKAVKVT